VRVERTADGVAMLRALEQHAPRPLFDDPLAARMLSGWPTAVVARRPLRWLFLHALERAGPGFYGAVICRTRAIDDACRAALATGTSRVVIVGAGMDTRPYRMEPMRHAEVWARGLGVTWAQHIGVTWVRLRSALQAAGGFCDCEVLTNVVDASAYDSDDDDYDD